jgi:hypothetical protein
VRAWIEQDVYRWQAGGPPVWRLSSLKRCPKSS